MKYMLILLCISFFCNVQAEVLDSIYSYRYDTVLKSFELYETQNFEYENGFISRRYTAKYDTAGKPQLIFRNNYTWLEKDYILKDTVEEYIHFQSWVPMECYVRNYNERKFVTEEDIYRLDIYRNSWSMTYTYDEMGRILSYSEIRRYPEGGPSDFTQGCTYEYRDSMRIAYNGSYWDVGESEVVIFDEYLRIIERRIFMGPYDEEYMGKPMLHYKYYFYNGPEGSVNITHNVKKSTYDKEIVVYKDNVVVLEEFFISSDSLEWIKTRKQEHVYGSKYYLLNKYSIENDKEILDFGYEYFYDDKGNILVEKDYERKTGGEELQWIHTRIYTYAQGNSVEGNTIAEPALKYSPAENAILIPESMPYSGKTLMLVSLVGKIIEIPVTSASVSLPQGLASGVYAACLKDAGGMYATPAVTFVFAR